MRFFARGTGPSIAAIAAAAISLGAAVTTGGLFAGCTPNQGVGERCSASNGNDDCTSGLVCRSSVCCPSNDTNCGATQVVTTDSGADALVPVDTGGADTGSADAYNSACVFNTDCPVGLACRSGHCTFGCFGDRDCENGKGCECASHSCTAATFSSDHKCGDAGVADAPAEVAVDSGADTVDETADTATVDSGTDTAVDGDAAD